MKQTLTSRIATKTELFSETKQLEREINALYSLLAGMLGAEKLVLKAGKLEALNLLRSQDLQERVLGLQIVIYNNPALKEVPALEEIPEILQELYDDLAEQIALQTVEETIEQKVAAKMQEKHDEYLLEIKKQLLKEEKGPENPQTLKKYAQLEKLRKKKLNRFALELLRPQKLEEIVGQEKAITALLAKLASPYPQHIIIYGPPGVGKTTAARLALEAAKKIKESPFAADAPFIEVDGTTLRWDPREIANPLLGSVHDPIYQGARRDLIDGGVPEPKPGLVTEAHGGILFIDEIGEMDIQLQSKLLKVLEDKKVDFESAYYDPTDPQVPKYIHELFTKGAPADFVLIGATTRPPHAINPALRSRCTAVFFEPLTPRQVETIVQEAAVKLKVELAEGAAALIADYTTEGRQAVNLLADAYGLALYRRRQEDNPVIISKELVQETLRAGRYVANTPKKKAAGEAVGKVYGLGVSGFLGSVLEIEAVAFTASDPGKGTIRFNETAGSMAKDSVFNAAAVIRRLTGEKLHNYDLHINVIGGGRIDGPSAGLAMVIVLLSAIKELPVSQQVAVTGEVSLQGQVRPVGGIAEKLFGARLAGIQTVLVPYENKADIPELPGMRVIPVKTVGEALPWLFGEKIKEASIE
ncbi:MAG: ATP-dependent protease, Lon family [Firmicutes bacterium]|mgnify:FL=1|nr:ATP-dependent protease, Lon family [Bacillota bacterium]